MKVTLFHPRIKLCLTQTGGTGRRGKAIPALSQLLVLHFLIFVQFGSAGEMNITAEPGQNVTLPCEAARNKHVTVLAWSKPDLGENDHVALYRDEQFNYHDLNPAYRNRVDLQDREMKDGNVSLVLRNVTTDDAGKYECRVIQREVKRRKRSHLKNEKPICIVTLDVSAPGIKEGWKDGGNEEEKNDGGNNTGVMVGLSVGVPVVLALLTVSGFLVYKKHRCSPQEQNQPPAAEAELQAMNVENHPEPEM